VGGGYAESGFRDELPITPGNLLMNSVVLCSSAGSEWMVGGHPGPVGAGDLVVPGELTSGCPAHQARSFCLRTFYQPYP
jgi:hypothetical protein